MASENGTSTFQLPTIVIQLIVTIILAGASSWIGVITGSAVLKSQMLDFDRRLSKVEQSYDAYNQQQIEILKNQLALATKQLETQAKEAK